VPGRVQAPADPAAGPGPSVTAHERRGRVPPGRENRAPGGDGPRVYVHVGEPKTGTTFLQDAMWRNRSSLAAQGVLLPGFSHQDHSRASRDLRGTPRLASDPAEPWTGEWDVLRREALCGPQTAVISDELLAACTARQADRAVRSLLAAEVHVILTVRDLATLLPAEWQEKVKCRSTVQWEEWLDWVIGAGSAADRRSRSWFWNVHDTLAILDAWSQHIPPDHVHVITMPSGGPAEELWARFASVLGIKCAGIDLSRARANSSLGLPEAELLRRVNEALPPDMPDWFYTRHVKRILAHEILGARPRQARLALPGSRQAWARTQAEDLVASLRDAKFDIVGDLGELLPQPRTGHYAQSPGQLPEHLLLEASVQAAAAFADRQYRAMYPAAVPRRRRGGPRQTAGQLTWRALNGARARRALRSASHLRAARLLRVAIWRALVRPARHT
jgi:hypothetical protein